MKKIFLFTLILSTISFSNLKDGTYIAETLKEATGPGKPWKTKVELIIKEGKISQSLIEGFKSNGELKTNDTKYNEIWMKKSGTNFNKVREKLNNELIESQNIDSIDSIAGATELTVLFKKLTKAAIKQSELGDITPIYLDIQ